MKTKKVKTALLIIIQLAGHFRGNDGQKHVDGWWRMMMMNDGGGDDGWWRWLILMDYDDVDA